VNARIGLAVAAVLASLALVPGGAAAATKKERLKAFASCSNFVHYARRHATSELATRGTPGTPEIFVRERQQEATGGPQPVATPQAPAADGGAGQDFSGTNVQEKGVDEPDAVKTDGKTIFVASENRLYAVDARSEPPKLLGSIALDGYGHQLLLDGNRLLVLSGSPIFYDFVVAPGRPMPVAEAATSPPLPGQQKSTLSLVDASDPAAMRVLRTMSVEGGYLSARMTGSTARVIFSATPQVLPALQTAQPAERPTRIRRTSTPSWRPSYTVRRGRKGKVARRALVRCTSIQRPETFSGLNSLTVLTIDLAKGLEPIDADAVLTDGQTVYGSTKSLYVATQKSIAEQPNAEQAPRLPVTAIHKFDITGGETRYLASGTVSGTLLNQYSMSEQDGLLRVASTDSPLWWSPGQNRESESFVTVLRQDGAVLRQAGRVGGLGKGERIYAVRFIGDMGYVVTFRQVDPLYTVSLANPEKPEVVGELKILGYSAYLHPVGDGLLLGVGQSATEQGRTEGTQVSLFDVSDPRNPARLSNQAIAGASSDAEFDPHAFLWWDPAKLAVIPLQVYDYDERSGAANSFIGAVGFRAARSEGVAEKGRISHPKDQYGYAPPITRSLVVGERIFTVSVAGVAATDLASMAERGFAAFPAAPQGNAQPVPMSTEPAPAR
jgi:hypothetical protein